MELPVNLSMTGRLTASVSFSGKERAITVKVHPCITKKRIKNIEFSCTRPYLIQAVKII